MILVLPIIQVMTGCRESVDTSTTVFSITDIRAMSGDDVDETVVAFDARWPADSVPSATPCLVVLERGGTRVDEEEIVLRRAAETVEVVFPTPFTEDLRPLVTCDQGNQ